MALKGCFYTPRNWLMRCFDTDIFERSFPAKGLFLFQWEKERQVLKPPSVRRQGVRRGIGWIDYLTLGKMDRSPPGLIHWIDCFSWEIRKLDHSISCFELVWMDKPLRPRRLCVLRGKTLFYVRLIFVKTRQLVERRQRRERDKDGDSRASRKGSCISEPQGNA